MPRLLTVGALLAALATGGCGWAEWPPPSRAHAVYPSRGTLQATPAPRSGQSATGGSDLTFVGADSVTVGPSDTVYSISQRHQVSQRALIEVNKLLPPYQLVPGQRLVLPRERVHTVVRGDTLYGISRRFGVDMYELAQANRLEPPYAIQVGQDLRIPAVPQVASPPPSSPAASGLQVEDLPPPAPARQGPAVTMLTPPSQPAPSSPPEQSEAPASPPVSSPVQPEAPAAPPSPPLAQPEMPALPTAPVVKGSGFIWPTRGHIILDFGPKAKGLHNDGVNIEAPMGTPVYAAQNGTVAYAGNELRGFGNLLLIKHAGGWITAYAHNETLLVKRGDTVTRGQVIARVGSTGNVTKPQLHFELRKGRQAVDPRSYLVGDLTS
jgi:murein DD-endopeptidase MepM/ murein hydrolase activator NlpD